MLKKENNDEDDWQPSLVYSRRGMDGACVVDCRRTGVCVDSRHSLGKACFVIGQFTFFPFGKEAISRKELKQKDDIGTGTLGTIGNVIWFIFAGIWLAIGHVSSALLNFITIIGIPFGIQHLKLAGIALAPIGKTVVSKEVAAAARKAH